MKTQIIKIDRSSIRLNPDAGNTSTCVGKTKIMSFTADRLPEYFKEGYNCVVDSHCFRKGVMCDFKGEILDDELCDRVLSERPEGVNVIVNVECHYTEHSSLSKYLYDYKSTKVLCGCGLEVSVYDEECECGRYNDILFRYESIDEISDIKI